MSIEDMYSIMASLFIFRTFSGKNDEIFNGKPEISDKFALMSAKILAGFIERSREISLDISGIISRDEETEIYASIKLLEWGVRRN